MQDLKDMTTDGLDVLCGFAAEHLMDTVKGHLVAEIQKAMANQAVNGGYEIAFEIGRRSIHRSTGFTDPMPDYGRAFANAESAIAGAIREAAVSIAREQLAGGEDA